MRLLRLRVSDLAAIREADIEFGPGLNVLYGPNDLGKSTLADAIRMALLLPHTSTYIDGFVPWTGGHDPAVEMTFQTEPQRIWRVKKEFRKGGTALLQESKNGIDFDDVERARRVDGRLRELIRWGIPEPGGAGGSKGLPTSFLATVLLSTQSDVTSVLSESLQDDPSGTGKEQIAAALQAVAQDPLFAALLRATQARRDEAFTDRGARKTAKGSVFKAASDRLNIAREEKERLQSAVDDSGGVEKQLRDFTEQRSQCEEALGASAQQLESLERLAAEATQLAAATERLRLAQQEVLRIQAIGTEVDAAERSAGELARIMKAAEHALRVAQTEQAEADGAFKAAEAVARTTGSDPTTTSTVARQRLELRRAAATQAAQEAQQKIDRAIVAQKLVDAVIAADHEHKEQQVRSEASLAALSDAVAKERFADEQLRGVNLLERALDAIASDEQVSAAQGDVDKDGALRAQQNAELVERMALEKRRAAITVPHADALGSMLRLATDLAGARGALNVGVVVTITPLRPIGIRVRKDGTVADLALIDEAMEVEASNEVDIDIGDVASVRIRGGQREAQQRAESLAARWSREVVPHLTAAEVSDLDGLRARVTEAHDLDTKMREKDAALQSLHAQIASLVNSAKQLGDALDRRGACHAALGEQPLESLSSELIALGADKATALRDRLRKLTGDVAAARVTATKASTAHTLAEERARSSGSALGAAVVARDVALAAFPDDVTAALSIGQNALSAALEEEQLVEAELTLLLNAIATESDRVEVAVREARITAEQAQARLDAAHTDRAKAIADHAAQVGRLEELLRLRDAQDLSTAERKLADATTEHAIVPIPERLVTEAEVAAKRNAKSAAVSELARIERDIQRAHGALEQVGGAVARERLRDAIEAYELAERQERDIEADYDAWYLLLDEMKQADTAQASNLGQVLAPAIASRFEALTQRRYEGVRLTAQLGTEGVVVGGAVRPTESMSVGTREQLSTLFRLSLAEYLSTTVVLDDQLVQSDDTRMDWFRALIAEKAHGFQIVVFTCRPGDYLVAGAMVPDGGAVHNDTDGGFVRAVDLGRAVLRR